MDTKLYLSPPIRSPHLSSLGPRRRWAAVKCLFINDFFWLLQ